MPPSRGMAAPRTPGSRATHRWLARVVDGLLLKFVFGVARKVSVWTTGGEGVQCRGGHQGGRQVPVCASQLDSAMSFGTQGISQFVFWARSDLCLKRSCRSMF